MGNMTRLRAPGQTRACEHYAMHVGHPVARCRKSLHIIKFSQLAL